MSSCHTFLLNQNSINHTSLIFRILSLQALNKIDAVKIILKMAIPPALYLSGIGDILTRITCSHIILLSDNVFYSHDNISTDTYHTFTVSRKYWPVSNFSNVPDNFQLLSWDVSFLPFHILGSLWNASKEHKMLEQYEIEDMLPNEGLRYLRTPCVYSIILFTPKRDWNFVIGNKPVHYFPIARCLGNLMEFLNYRFTLPIILLELKDTNQTLLTPKEIYGIEKASDYFTHLIAIQRCTLTHLNSILSNLAVNCTYHYVCNCCFPKSTLLDISVDTLFDLKSFLGFISTYGTPKYYHAELIERENLTNYRTRRNIFLFPKQSKFDFKIVIALLTVEQSKHNLTLFLDNQKSSAQESTEMGYLKPVVYAEARLEPKYFTTFGDCDRDFLFVVVGNAGYRFLTCYSNEFLNFNFYALPFQSNLWIGVLVTIPVLILCFWKLLGNLGHLQRQQFSPLLYMIRCLLENGPNLPKCIESNLIAKLLSATWLLLSLIAANGYKGIVSTDVTAPLPKETPFKVILDLVGINAGKNLYLKPGIKLYSEMTKSCVETWQNSEIFQTPINVSEISNCQTSASVDLKNACGIKAQLILEQWLSPRNPNQSVFHIYNALEEEIMFKSRGFWLPSRPKQPDISFEAALESEIVQCDNKAVLIGRESHILLEQQYLQKQYPLKTFFVSENKSMFAQSFVWRFNNPRETRIPHRFVAIVESGIYQQIKVSHEKWKQFGFRLGFSKINSKEESTKPLTLSSNLRTLFYLGALFVAVALSAGLSEIFWCNRLVIYCELKDKTGSMIRLLKNMNRFSHKVLWNWFLSCKYVLYCICRKKHFMVQVKL